MVIVSWNQGYLNIVLAGLAQMESEDAFALIDILGCRKILAS